MKFMRVKIKLRGIVGGKLKENRFFLIVGLVQKKVELILDIKFKYDPQIFFLSVKKVFENFDLYNFRFF